MTTPGVSHPSPTTVEEFRRVLDERSVQPVVQPLIDLDSRHVLGYEALARGPAGSARLLATVAQAREAGWGSPWTTSAPHRPAWPCCRSSAPT